MAISVKLRHKAITGGRQSLYLDFYPAIKLESTGKETRRQFLDLFIYDKPKTPVEKAHNKEVIIQADRIRSNKENELKKPEIYSGEEQEKLRLKEQGNQSFTEYFQTLSNKRSGQSKVIWDSVLMHLQNFHKGELKFNDVTETLCNDFKEYLLTAKIAKSGRATLANNSALVYFSKFKAVLRQAYKDRFISLDLNANIDAVKEEETRRSVLTIDEVNALIQTECSSPAMKKAAIFSTYTGLRFSDIQKLTWGEIEEVAQDEFVINFKQKKTRGIETLPISKDALQFVEPRRGNNDRVIEGLLYSAYYNKILAKWIGLAGITKDITFHSFRHTFATLHLFLGTDIYTVSKMLGHRDIKTTQIYAKIVDETKRVAANRIQLKIDNWK